MVFSLALMLVEILEEIVTTAGIGIANIPKPFAQKNNFKKQLAAPNFAADNHWNQHAGNKGRND